MLPSRMRSLLEPTFTAERPGSEKMKRSIELALATLAMFLSAAPLSAQQPAQQASLRPVHTFSIVARDPETGDLGVAVQSHWFSVGSIVPWAEAGVGAVATQSLVEVSYGPKGLALMSSGRSGKRTLDELLAQDSN